MIDIVHDPIGAPLTPEAIVHPNVVFLLDESGSMTGYRSEVVSTFNEYVEKVRETAKTISLYTFDSNGIREKIYKIPPARVKRLTLNDYSPNAATPLYDAVGIVLKKFEHETRPVQFVGHTDGQENASQEWTKPTLDEYIARLSAKDNNPWLFTWLMEGLSGREALHNFQGLKYGMSNVSRGAAMGAVADSTVMYAQTMDSNPTAYTVSGTDTEDLDADGKKSSAGGDSPVSQTSGGTT